MKTFLTVILCLAILQFSVNASQSVTNDQPEAVQQPNSVLLGIIIILTVVVVGATVVHKVKTTIPDNHSPVKLVLEKSMDHSNWTPVITNTVTLNGTNAIEFFREDMTDSIAFYRARVVK